MAPPQVGARVSMALYLPSVAVPEVTNGLRYSLSDRADANLTGGLPLMRMMQQFSTEEAARAYFEQIRWPDERRFCPHCGNADTARIWKVTPNPERRIVIADKSGKRMITFDVKAKKLLIEAGKGDVEIAVAKKLVFDSEDLEIKTKKTGKIESRHASLAKTRSDSSRPHEGSIGVVDLAFWTVAHDVSRRNEQER